MDLTEFMEKHQALTDFLATKSPTTAKGAARIAEEIKEAVEPLREWVGEFREKVEEVKNGVEEMEEWVDQIDTAIENIESGADELDDAGGRHDRAEVHTNLVTEAESLLDALGEIGAVVLAPAR